MPPQKIEVDAVKTVRRYLTDDLYRFVKAAWPIVVQNHEFIDGWHVKAICEHLQAVTEGKVPNLLINVPPRHTKSLIVSVMWPAWVWAQDPTVQWIFSSRALSVSLRDNRKCRLLIESNWYQSLWPEVQLATDQNVKSYYATTRGGHRLATSTGSTNIGLDADVLVVDDMHGINDSDDQIASHIENCEESLWSRGNTETAPRVVIGQRVGGGDISNHILSGKATGKWCAVVLPMEYDPDRHCKTMLGWEDPRTKRGELLAPNRRSQAWVDNFKAKRPHSHATLNQQAPVPLEGGIWKREWLQNRFRVLEFEKVTRWATSCDTPFKGRNRSKGEPDYYAHVMIAEKKRQIETGDKDNPIKTIIDYYILGCHNEQLDYPNMKKAFREFANFWDAVLGGAIHLHLVEDKANGSAIIDDLGHEFPNIEPYEPGKIKKELRFELVAPTIKGGRLHFPEPGAVIVRNGEVIHQIDAGFVDEMVGQFGAIPGAANDDMADAFAQYDLHNRYGNTAPPPLDEISIPSVDVYTIQRQRSF